MTAAMAAFAIEDAVIKYLSARLPISQILVGVGFCGVMVFAVIARMQGVSIRSRSLMTMPFVIRTLSELASALLFVSAMVYASLSTSTAILQATPLAVAIGGALYLKQVVSRVQWILIGLGFFGVLLVIQPGAAGFQPAALFAVAGVGFLALRDVITRTFTTALSTAAISVWAFAAVFGAGIVSIPIFGPFQPIDLATLWWFVFSAAAGCSGYYAVVMATRGGDVAVVAPFRYSRLVFALGLAMVFFDERPNDLALIGALCIVVSGILTLTTQRTGRARIDPDLAI